MNAGNSSEHSNVKLNDVVFKYIFNLFNVRASWFRKTLHIEVLVLFLLLLQLDVKFLGAHHKSESNKCNYKHNL